VYRINSNKSYITLHSSRAFQIQQLFNIKLKLKHSKYKYTHLVCYIFQMIKEKNRYTYIH